MKQEQLERAKQIESALSALRSNKNTWESSARFRDSIVLTNGKHSSYINNDLIDFETLRQFTLININKQIAALETEFAAL